MCIWQPETTMIPLPNSIQTAVSLPAMNVFGEDATAVFNMLSGYSEPKSWNKLIVAPIWMKDRFLSLIEREAENAKKGLPALIRAKMNSLCDPKIIAGLYYASPAEFRWSFW